jgi:hypothetical protein
VALIVGVALVAMPARALVSGSARPLVVRLACAVVIAVVLLHLRRGLVRRIEDEEAAAMTAPPGASSPPVTPVLDPWFVDLHESVRWSVRSERYFERVLLPRLRALARRGVDGPRPGGWGRRGRLAHLRALVARLERQP